MNVVDAEKWAYTCVTVSYTSDIHPQSTVRSSKPHTTEITMPMVYVFTSLSTFSSPGARRQFVELLVPVSIPLLSVKRV